MIDLKTNAQAMIDLKTNARAILAVALKSTDPVVKILALLCANKTKEASIRLNQLQTFIDENTKAILFNIIHSLLVADFAAFYLLAYQWNALDGIDSNIVDFINALERFVRIRAIESLKCYSPIRTEKAKALLGLSVEELQRQVVCDFSQDFLFLLPLKSSDSSLLSSGSSSSQKDLIDCRRIFNLLV